MTSLELIQQTLKPNEKLLWQGKPKPGWALKTGDSVRLPLMMLFTGFAVFWTIQATQFTTPPNLWLFGIPFILFGVYFCVIRYWVEKQQRQHTHYALTNKQVLIACTWRRNQITAVAHRDIHHVFLFEKPNGDGTLIFGGKPSTITPFLPQRIRPNRFMPAFERIENVRAVLKHLQGLGKTTEQL